MLVVIYYSKYFFPKPFYFKKYVQGIYELYGLVVPIA